MISAPNLPNIRIRWSCSESQIGVLKKYSCIYIIYKDIFCVLKWRPVVYYLWSLDVTECKVTFWCQKMPYIFLVSVITSCSQNPPTLQIIQYLTLVWFHWCTFSIKKCDPNMLSSCLSFTEPYNSICCLFIFYFFSPVRSACIYFIHESKLNFSRKSLKVNHANLPCKLWKLCNIYIKHCRLIYFS